MEQFETQELNLESEHKEIETPLQHQTNENKECTQVVVESASDPDTRRKESPFADSPYVTNFTWSDSAPPAAAKKKRESGRFWKRLLTSVLTVALVAGSCGMTATVVNHRWEEKTQAMMVQVQAQIADLQQQIHANANSNAASGSSVSGTVVYGDGLTPAQVYAQNVRAVVMINCTISTSYRGQITTATSSGSGFVLTESGYVVTNAHVVEDATSVSVTMHDGTEYEALPVGMDATNDVAVLKIEAEGSLQAVTLGSSSNLIVGDQVVAIGNPLGELTSTMTVGYISAKDRDVNTEGTTINMIQTDAAINSGNSGGPMFNMYGQVVGITTAKYSGESASGATIEGIGFAIPIDDVLPLVEDLINYGYINSAYLGVMVSDMDPETASYYGLPVGAYVQEVVDGYGAREAGVQAKDIIVAVGNIEVGSVSDLTRALRQFKAGDTTTITVYRSGAELVLEITLDEKPQTTETAPVVPDDSSMPQDGSYEEWYNYFAPFFGGGAG